MDVKKIIQIVAHEEGFYKAGSPPQVARNPGDLELGDIGNGVYEGNKTIFATDDAGWAAAERQWDRMLTGKSHIYKLDWTLAQVGLKYSGGDPNWSHNVAAMLGVPETITLAELAAA